MSYRPALPFTPYPAATQALAVSNASARVALPSATRQVMCTSIANDALCFLEFGGSGVVTVVPSGGTLGGTPLNGGDAQLFSVPISASYVAAITSSGTATLYITPAEGI